VLANGGTTFSMYLLDAMGQNQFCDTQAFAIGGDLQNRISTAFLTSVATTLKLRTSCWATTIG
jgi:hypothetical protein